MLLRGVAMVTMATDSSYLQNQLSSYKHLKVKKPGFEIIAPSNDSQIVIMVTVITLARNNIFSKTFQLNDHHDPLYQQGVQTHFP